MTAPKIAGLFLLCGTMLAQPPDRAPVPSGADTDTAKPVTYGLRSDKAAPAARDLKVEGNKLFDADGVLAAVSTDHEAISHDYDETSHAMNGFKNDNKNLAAATDLENAIYNVLERTTFEGWLLDMYDHVTEPEALRDAERMMRKRYADLGALTAVDAHAVRLVLGNCESKNLCALASKAEGDIQKIADRYRLLSKE